MKKLFIAICVAFVGINYANAQSAKWLVNPADADKVFIENKGQFQNKDLNSNSDIRYGVQYLGMQLYYSPKGITWRYDLREPLTKPEHEGDTEEEFLAENRSSAPLLFVRDQLLPIVVTDEVKGRYEQQFEQYLYTPQRYTLGMEWQGANPNSQIVPEDKVSHLHHYAGDDENYCKGVHAARGYNKLVYRDIYPHIDVEYFFASQMVDGKMEDGIKYAFILHPGANPADIRMKYSTSNIQLDTEGNMEIETPAGQIKDLKPYTYYTDSKAGISSSFSLNGSEVSFSLGSYDASKTITIDPFTINPLFPTQNIVCDMQMDGTGCSYIFGNRTNGGGGVATVRRYSAGGVLRWSLAFPTISLIGDIAAEKNGNIYICDGSRSGGNAGLYKYDSTGVLIWDNFAADNSFELWRLRFNRPLTQLYVAGMSISQTSCTCIGTVNMTTGAFSATGDPGIGASCGTADHEPRALTVAPSGRLYTLNTCEPPQPIPPTNAACHGVFGFNAALGRIFNVYSGYTLGYSTTPNYTGYSGQNALAAGKNFLYTWNGAVAMRRNPTTGAQIGANLSPPNGSAQNCSGVVTDSCDKVFFGTMTGIKKYSEDLSTLEASVLTPGAVYDVDIGLNGEFLAAGAAFFGSFAGLNTCQLVVAPVELIQFNAIASKTKRQVNITWSTATEKNNNYFSLERSRDGISYYEIARLKGAGNSTTKQQYQYIDNPAKDEGSLVYYRLKQVDFDNKFNYSSIITSVLKSVFEVNGIQTYSYDASSGNLNYRLDTDEENTSGYALHICNIWGQVLLTVPITVNEKNSISLSNFASGVFLCYTTSGNGKGQTFKIVKP